MLNSDVSDKEKYETKSKLINTMDFLLDMQQEIITSESKLKALRKLRPQELLIVQINIPVLAGKLVKYDLKPVEQKSNT